MTAAALQLGSPGILFRGVYTMPGRRVGTRSKPLFNIYTRVRISRVTVTSKSVTEAACSLSLVQLLGYHISGPIIFTVRIMADTTVTVRDGMVCGPHFQLNVVSIERKVSLTSRSWTSHRCIIYSIFRF